MKIRIGIASLSDSGRTQLRDHVSRLIREHRARQQELQPGRIREAERFEHVWRRASPMEEHPTAWVEHRVLRRSRNSALVEANPVVAAPQPGVHGASRRIPGYWIDQQELERRGFTRVRSRRTIFFATPHASDELVETLDALVRLGLWIPYSEDDLKQAFRRLALRLHPDAGGTDSRFIRLQDDFNRASQALNNHWWSE